MKILIADDHQLLADALTQLVKENEADAEVLQAGSLDDAMEKMDRDGAVEIGAFPDHDRRVATKLRRKALHAPRSEHTELLAHEKTHSNAERLR